jgi:hypothetical protein
LGRHLVYWLTHSCYICHTCCGSIDKWGKLVAKAEEMKWKVMANLGKVIHESVLETSVTTAQGNDTLYRKPL